MKTTFTPQQLADPAMQTSEKAIRACVHCGFCTATCPTYVLLGDERDSPRGRIWLAKEMLEKGDTPTPQVVKHIDRCLSCLACATTCPSGVDYMHLIDHARTYIETNYRRPPAERWMRALISVVLPYRERMYAALRLARIVSPLAGLLGRIPSLAGIAAMLTMAGENRPYARSARASAATGPRKGRVLLLQGCVEPVLRPDMQAAAARVLNRIGYDVERAANEGCCGGLPHHMGREHDALAMIRRNVDAWTPWLEKADLAAIVVTASGCGVTLKDYGHILRTDPVYAERAARISKLAKDPSELISLAGLELRREPAKMRIAYHAACTLQHGQKLGPTPRRLLEAAGFIVLAPDEAHLCCGSAGVYNILQPEIAGKLGERKTQKLEALRPDVIATTNIGCALQIGARTGVPVVHVAELLDWATGGPAPPMLAGARLDRRKDA